VADYPDYIKPYLSSWSGLEIIMIAQVKLLGRLDHKMLKQVDGAMLCWEKSSKTPPGFNPDAHTACMCVESFNGVGINTFP
jgi:hypothetical protein